MTKHLPYAEAKVIYDKILAIDVDKVPVVTYERVYHKNFAQQLRTLLRRYGINSRMVSITSPNYSMALAIDVDVPQIASEHTYAERNAMSPEELTAFTNLQVERNDERWAAVEHLRSIIDKAFPDCYDRSDVQSDYFHAYYYCS